MRLTLRRANAADGLDCKTDWMYCDISQFVDETSKQKWDGVLELIGHLMAKKDVCHFLKVDGDKPHELEPMHRKNKWTE